MADKTDSPEEEWRAIPGHKNYEVSSLGRVRRSVASHQHRAGFMLNPSVSTYGYHKVGLCEKRKYTHITVHQLVARAFLGPPPTPDHQVAHWDGNGLNNRVENLRWATSKENHSDRIRHGMSVRCPRGSRHWQARLTEDAVRDIRRKLGSGVSAKLLAEEYGVSDITIYDIKVGRTWNHVK